MNKTYQCKISVKKPIQQPRSIYIQRFKSKNTKNKMILINITIPSYQQQDISRHNK